MVTVEKIQMFLSWKTYLPWYLSSRLLFGWKAECLTRNFFKMSFAIWFLVSAQYLVLFIMALCKNCGFFLNKFTSLWSIFSGKFAFWQCRNPCTKHNSDFGVNLYQNCSSFQSLQIFQALPRARTYRKQISAMSRITLHVRTVNISYRIACFYKLAAHNSL